MRLAVGHDFSLTGRQQADTPGSPLQRCDGGIDHGCPHVEREGVTGELLSTAIKVNDSGTKSFRGVRGLCESQNQALRDDRRHRDLNQTSFLQMVRDLQLQRSFCCLAQCFHCAKVLQNSRTSGKSENFGGLSTRTL